MYAIPPLIKGRTPAIASILPSDVLIIPIVKPAAEAPLPEVYIDLCVILSASTSNTDFAILGSPANSMLMSALFLPSTPPAIMHSIDSLIFLLPYT